jgi:hypothetical protein
LARQGLVEDEGVRSARLLDAQARAAELFAAIEPRGIIAPGVRETEASDAIRDLAAEMFGVSRHWHKRIVRAGPNGQVCHWILEVHLVEEDRQIGGFFEELLDLGPGPA